RRPRRRAEVQRRTAISRDARVRADRASALRSVAAIAAVILRLPEPGAAKQRNGGGRRRISSFPSCVESQSVSAGVAHLEILHRPAALRLRLRRLRRLRMTACRAAAPCLLCYSAPVMTDINIDQLVHTAVFGDGDAKAEARRTIHLEARRRGAVSSSIYPFYMALGRNEIERAFTVPAFNIRALTYDAARALF